MNVNHNWLALLAGLWLGPDIQTQTILAHRDARVRDACENAAAHIGNAVHIDKLLGEVGVVGANVGWKTSGALDCHLSARSKPQVQRLALTKFLPLILLFPL